MRRVTIDIPEEAVEEAVVEVLQEHVDFYMRINDDDAFWGSPEEIRELRQALKTVLAYFSPLSE